MLRALLLVASLPAASAVFPSPPPAAFYGASCEATVSFPGDSWIGAEGPVHRMDIVIPDWREGAQVTVEFTGNLTQGLDTGGFWSVQDYAFDKHWYKHGDNDYYPRHVCECCACCCPCIPPVDSHMDYSLVGDTASAALSMADMPSDAM